MPRVRQSPNSRHRRCLFVSAQLVVVKGRRSMKKSGALLLPLLLILVLALVACGKSAGTTTGNNTPSNEVSMDATSFLSSSVTIKAGESVHFVDPGDGALHILCSGEDGQC